MPTGCPSTVMRCVMTVFLRLAAAVAPAAAGGPARCGPMTVKIMARDVAPGSAVPTLFSASGRARPFSGRSDAVASAAAVASRRRLRPTPGAVCCASAATSRLKVSVKGSRASTMVLSPVSALPRPVILVRERADAGGQFHGVGAALVAQRLRRRPAARRPTARRRCRRLCPPMRHPAAARTAPAPAPLASGVCGGGRCGVDAADHSAAVVAVAGNGVHVPEPGFGAVQAVTGGSPAPRGSWRVLARLLGCLESGGCGGAVGRFLRRARHRTGRRRFPGGRQAFRPARSRAAPVRRPAR